MEFLAKEIALLAACEDLQNIYFVGVFVSGGSTVLVFSALDSSEWNVKILLM